MPTATLPGKLLAGLDHQRRIAHGNGAENDAGQPARQPVLDMLERADAAAELDRIFRRLQDRIDGSTVDGLAGKGAVEIDHVQPFETLVLEGLGLGAGVGIVDGRLLHVAELEAHALAVFEVDGGKKDHVRASSAGNSR